MNGTQLHVEGLGSHKKWKLTYIRCRHHMRHPIREHHTGVVVVSPPLTIGEGGEVDGSIGRLVIKHRRHEIFRPEHELIIGVDTPGVREVEGHGP